MNDAFEPRSPGDPAAADHTAPLVDDSTLDRLVDGEVHGAEYRRLLVTLEATPDGWRRCALAFLSAQALRRELSLPVPAVTAAAPVPHVPANVPQPASGWSATHWLALAASWLMVFGLAWEWSAARHDSRSPAPSATGVTTDLPRPSPALPPPTPSPAPAANGMNWVRTEERVLPRQLVEQLRERGHDLQVREHFFPLQLQDGQQVIVPVQEMKVAPVRRVTY
ncbi:MAG: hypothetical protein U0935_06225 [Pirellulales bacterium]